MEWSFLNKFNKFNVSDSLIIIILFILLIIFLYFSLKLKKIIKISEKYEIKGNEKKYFSHNDNFEKIDNRKKAYSNEELEIFNKELKEVNISINKIMEKTTNIYEEVLKIEKLNSNKIFADNLNMNNVEPGPHLTDMIENINNNIDPMYINFEEEEFNEMDSYQKKSNFKKINSEIKHLKEEEKLLKQELYLLLNEMKNIVAVKTYVPISEISPKKKRIEELIMLISKHEKTIVDLIKYKNDSQNLEFTLSKINPIIQKEGNINK